MLLSAIMFVALVILGFGYIVLSSANQENNIFIKAAGLAIGLIMMSLSVFALLYAGYTTSTGEDILNPGIKSQTAGIKLSIKDLEQRVGKRLNNHEARLKKIEKRLWPPRKTSVKKNLSKRYTPAKK